MMEGQQEEHSSADLAQVISWVHDLCGLPSTPAKSLKKMWCFYAAQDLGDQPSSSYCLSRGDILSDILKDIDDRITSLCLRCGRRCQSCYLILEFIVDIVIALRVKRLFIITLYPMGRMKSCYNLNKTDMVFTCTEVEDLEATVRALLKVTSWMNWWFYATKSLTMCNTSKNVKVQCLFVTRGRMQLLIAKSTLTTYTNLMVK